MREQRLAERKRQRAEERARRAAGKGGMDLPADDSDLEAEAQIAAMLEDQLSEREEDLLDDLGLDMNQIVSHMAKQAKDFADKKTEN